MTQSLRLPVPGLSLPQPFLPDPTQFVASLQHVERGVANDSFSVEIPNAVYHSQLAYISHSGMIELLRSPAHYYAYLTEDREEGTTPNIGSAAHCALLEPKVFADLYIVYAGRRQGKAWDDFKAANASKIILNTKEKDAVDGIVEAVRNFSDFPLWALLRSAQTEKSIFWTDPKTGVGCRVRIDALCPHVILDLKTIDDARPEKIERHAAQMEYDLQAGMYREGVRAFTGKTLPFVFVFIEVKPPHGIWIHTAGPGFTDNGLRKFQRGVRAFKQLRDTGDWHGYRNSMSVLELPRYARMEDDAEDCDAAYS